jgi:protein-arginine kinase
VIAEQISKIQAAHPENLMARFFDPEYFDGLPPAQQERLERIINTGLKNPDSIMGAYAMQAEDYDCFRPYLDQLIRAYHCVDKEQVHISDWDLQETLDLSRIDPSLADTSMRVRVGRNLADFALPGAMTRDARVELEERLIAEFDALASTGGFGGSYVSLTPGSRYEISIQRYHELVEQHKMFKDMSEDPYLHAAGISADWPYGRGMYQSADGSFLVWVGEEDHLRVMSMRLGAILNELFDRLKHGLELLQSRGLQFSRNDSYGYVTSCPTNLGTGMRASLHLPLPRLMSFGIDALKAQCRELGLSVRGAGGEHTAAGAGGIVDISPSARLMTSEGEIARRLYRGAQVLWEREGQTPEGSDK